MGAKRVVNLPVSAPFHCSLMRPAAEALRQRLVFTRDLAHHGHSALRLGLSDEVVAIDDAVGRRLARFLANYKRANQVPV